MCERACKREIAFMCACFICLYMYVYVNVFIYTYTCLRMFAVRMRVQVLTSKAHQTPSIILCSVCWSDCSPSL